MSVNDNKIRTMVLKWSPNSHFVLTTIKKVICKILKNTRITKNVRYILFGDICQTCKINKPKFRLISFVSLVTKSCEMLLLTKWRLCPLSDINCWECPTNKCLSI